MNFLKPKPKTKPKPSPREQAINEAEYRWAAWDAALRIATIYKKTPVPDEARAAIVAHALMQARVDPALTEGIALAYAVAAVNSTLRSHDDDG